MTREDDFISPVKDVDYWEFGLGKREYFAAIALQGILSGNKHADLALAARSAVDAADCLIKELNRAP